MQDEGNARKVASVDVEEEEEEEEHEDEENGEVDLFRFGEEEDEALALGFQFDLDFLLQAGHLTPPIVTSPGKQLTSELWFCWLTLTAMFNIIF